MERPLFNTAWMRFQEINRPAAAVGQKIGGNVGLNLGSGAIQNAAALRLSFVLNRGGARIPRIANCTISGADGSWYFPRVRDLQRFLLDRFGEPDVQGAPWGAPLRVDDLRKQRGVLLFDVPGASDQSGHVTLWNGSMAADASALAVTRSAQLWRLR